MYPLATNIVPARAAARAHGVGAALLLILLCIAPAALCATVETVLPSGVLVRADYRDGRPERPAVLLLHGFLQTRHYLTLSSLADVLAQAGYTVLAPTLSLGIDRRARSLACEAVHTHRLADDLAEVTFWIQWLGARDHTRVVLLGHSFGAALALLHLAHGDPAVEGVIAVSPVDLAPGPDALRAPIARARARAAAGDTAPHPYPLSYCRHYVSPARSFLSYAEVSQRRLLRAMRSDGVPVAVIYGSEDRLISAQWAHAMRAAGARMRRVDGANHFFGAEYEFAFQDEVLGLLERLGRRRP